MKERNQSVLKWFWCRELAASCCMTRNNVPLTTLGWDKHIADKQPLNSLVGAKILPFIYIVLQHITMNVVTILDILCEMY